METAEIQLNYSMYKEPYGNDLTIPPVPAQSEEEITFYVFCMALARIVLLESVQRISSLFTILFLFSTMLSINIITIVAAYS